ncbi:hypothetical protein MMRN_p1180 (plasmid) [Mycobacterium marinum]|nr:hypothetical protein MMRN_p1180 [Mycobacterium marinum]
MPATGKPGHEIMVGQTITDRCSQKKADCLGAFDNPRAELVIGIQVGIGFPGAQHIGGHPTRLGPTALSGVAGNPQGWARGNGIVSGVQCGEVHVIGGGGPPVA